MFLFVFRFFFLIYIPSRAACRFRAASLSETKPRHSCQVHSGTRSAVCTLGEQLLRSAVRARSAFRPAGFQRDISAGPRERDTLLYENPRGVNTAGCCRCCERESHRRQRAPTLGRTMSTNTPAADRERRIASSSVPVSRSLPRPALTKEKKMHARNYIYIRSICVGERSCDEAFGVSRAR